MAETRAAGGYAIYWRIWMILLVVTLVMVFVDRPAALALGGGEPMVPAGLLVFILVVAMLFKAQLIAGYFMHLRFEGMYLRVSVAVGLLVLSAILFFLILPDGLRILEMKTG